MSEEPGPEWVGWEHGNTAWRTVLGLWVKSAVIDWRCLPWPEPSTVHYRSQVVATTVKKPLTSWSISWVPSLGPHALLVSSSLQFCEAGPVILTLVYRRGDRGLRRLSLVLKATGSEQGLCRGQVLDHHTLGHQWGSCVPVPGQLCPQEMPVVVNVTGWPQFPHLISGAV